jgi:hypothetical protein
MYCRGNGEAARLKRDNRGRLERARLGQPSFIQLVSG